MSSAIIGGMDKKQWEIVVLEIFEPQRKKLEELYGVETIEKPTEKLNDVDAIVLAVKPQVINTVLESLKPFNLSGKTIVSIMAGIPVKTIESQISGKDITFVRTMPNTPLLVGRGVTGIYLTNPSSKDMMESIFGPIGEVFFFDKEDDLNIVTAISGSGPAYFFLFIESLSKAGQDLGLSKDIADRMAIQTALGASTLASQSEEDVATLRKNVTSDKGTTEAAILKFQSLDLGKIVKDSVNAAYQRSIELASEFESRM